MEDTDRAALAARCAEAIGVNPEESVLCQVLGFFPDKAELFIRTQQHATKINGRKAAVWCIARHKQAGRGLDGIGYYHADEDEHLDLPGYTGKQILDIISHIEQLRGVGTMGYIDFFADDNISVNILSTADAKGMITGEYTRIIAKILEVMNVTPEEIEMIREALDDKKSSYEIEQKALALIAQAEALKEEAKSLRKAASLKINEVYPRATAPQH